jgi:hypothetical protein
MAVIAKGYTVRIVSVLAGGSWHRSRRSGRTTVAVTAVHTIDAVIAVSILAGRRWYRSGRSGRTSVTIAPVHAIYAIVAVSVLAGRGWHRSGRGARTAVAIAAVHPIDAVVAVSVVASGHRGWSRLVGVVRLGRCRTNQNQQRHTKRRNQLSASRIEPAAVHAHFLR